MTVEERSSPIQRGHACSCSISSRDPQKTHIHAISRMNASPAQQVAARTATSAYRNGATLDLGSLPDKALEETTGAERHAVADVIGRMASWPWLGASTASKTLHKKRPALIPVLDNMAIFGAYMNPNWPENPALADTIKAVPRIKEALDWITVDITCPENGHS